MVRPYEKTVTGLVYVNRSCQTCTACELRKQAGLPVCSSPGMTNVPIIGEAPGKVEDRQGMGFVGPAGKLLWQELSKHGLNRGLFHVMNAVKCYPSVTRTPNEEQLKTCSTLWLMDELRNLSPPLVLSLGNIPRMALSGNSTGIMAVSGMVEYVESIEARVCWSIHPSSVLMGDEKRPLFERGIATFVKWFKREYEYAVELGTIGAIEGVLDEKRQNKG